MGDDSILLTERLRLRYQREGDIPFLAYLWTDEDMTRHTGGPRDRAMLEEEFGRVARDPRGLEWDLWVLEDRTDGRLVGQAGFIPKDLDGRRYVELNYYIDKRSWRRGYAAEIAKALIEHAFNARGLSEVIAIIDPGNAGSERVAVSAGMAFWKTARRGDVEKSVYRISSGT